MKRWLHYSQLARTNLRRQSGAGYTIFEVLVVLAVMTALFFAISLAFRGRQARVEFSQAVRAYEAKLQNIMSEVANGYYESHYDCTITSSPTGQPGLLGSVVEPGKSEGCIFMGKVIVSGELESRIITLAGRRTVAETLPSGVYTREVRNINEAAVRLIPDGVIGSPNEFGASFAHNFRLRVNEVVSLTDNTTQVAAFAFVSPLSSAVSANKLSQLYGYTNSPVGADPSTLTSLVHLGDGLIICLEGQNGQHAELTIGTNNGQTTISSVLDTPATGVCSA